jgi:hypothetical protein
MYEESRGLDGYRCEYRKEVYHHREEVDKSSSESLMGGREMGTRLSVGCHTLIAVASVVPGTMDFVLPLMVVGAMCVAFDMGM